MSAFGKSALFNGENIASETVREDFETNSTVENQVSKFDNSYSTNEKLQELYNEFDKITLDENKIKDIISGILYEFPVTSIGIDLPNWFRSLDEDDKLRTVVTSTVLENSSKVSNVRSVSDYINCISAIDEITDISITSVDLSCGKVCVKANIDNSYFYTILSEKCEIKISNEQDLMREISALSKIKREWKILYNFKLTVEKIYQMW